MATVHEVKIEPLTDEAFVPFGQIISVKDRVPDFQTASGTRGWAVDFQSGTPLLMLLHTPYQGLSFTKLERHINVTQTFLPMGGLTAGYAGPRALQLTQEVDFATRFGVTFALLL